MWTNQEKHTGRSVQFKVFVARGTPIGVIVSYLALALTQIQRKQVSREQSCYNSKCYITITVMPVHATLEGLQPKKC